MTLIVIATMTERAGLFKDLGAIFAMGFSR
jgi:hypothetical protein